MENMEVIKKYSITKKTGLMIMGQIVLIMFALALTIFGIVKSVNMPKAWIRIVIYSGQALTCIAIIVFGTVYFNKKDAKYFRSVIIAYAILEALRVSMLSVEGVSTVYAILSKFLLVSLACDAILLSERIDKKQGLYVSIAMIVLEIILYGVFIIGFPLIRTRVLFMALPFVGILIAGSICLFIVGRNEQKQYSKKD